MVKYANSFYSWCSEVKNNNQNKGNAAEKRKHCSEATKKLVSNDEIETKTETKCKLTPNGNQSDII